MAAETDRRELSHCITAREFGDSLVTRWFPNPDRARIATRWRSADTRWHGDESIHRAVTLFDLTDENRAHVREGTPDSNAALFRRQFKQRRTLRRQTHPR
jgi:hypothetical protein